MENNQQQEIQQNVGALQTQGPVIKKLEDGKGFNDGTVADQFHMDINQVSMSSIEPAANVLQAHHESGKLSAQQQQDKQLLLSKVQVKRGTGGTAYSGNNTPAKSSAEKGIDEESVNEKNIDDIPQFTIGPSAGDKNFASSTANAPAQALQQKYGSAQPSPNLRIADGRKYSLKKNTFESDLGLQTGRFHNDSNQAFAGAHKGSPTKDGNAAAEEQMAKRAKQAQVMTRTQDDTAEGGVNSQKNVSNLENTELTKPEYEDAQEQEMRETSYFRHQTDDEHHKSSPEGKPLSHKKGQAKDRVPVTDKQHGFQQEPAMLEGHQEDFGPSDASSGLAPQQTAASVEEGSQGRQRFSRGSKNQNSHKEGIQMFKISSKSQMRQNRAQVAQRPRKVNGSLHPQGSAGGAAISDFQMTSEVAESQHQPGGVIEPFSPRSGVEFPPAMSEVSEQLQDLQHSVEQAQEARSHLNLNMADFPSNFNQSSEHLAHLSPHQRDLGHFDGHLESTHQGHAQRQQQNQHRRRAGNNIHQAMQNTPTSKAYVRLPSSGPHHEGSQGLGELGARSMKQQLGAMVLAPGQGLPDSTSQSRDHSAAGGSRAQKMRQAALHEDTEYPTNLGSEELLMEGQGRQDINTEPNSAATAAAARKQDYGMSASNNITGNFAALKLQKQAASGAAERVNYSVLKGPNPLNDSYARDVAVRVDSEHGEGPLRQNSEEDFGHMPGGIGMTMDGDLGGVSHLIPSDQIEPHTAGTQVGPNQQQMFTSMSDIGFPQHAQEGEDGQKGDNKVYLQSKSKGDPHAKALGSERTQPATLGTGLQGRGKLAEITIRAQSGSTRPPARAVTDSSELITTEQISKLMDAQHNWRVRTMTIDQILHDVQERVEIDPDYMMLNSERLLDFFITMLNDQNFKIVLNTLNVLNMIVAMREQRLRYEIMVRRPQDLPEEARNGTQPYGLSNAFLGRHIPQLVKKLADSKAIIRQEAIRCLFHMNEIMRSGNKKDNNFIALILPYLNNSSNWHIREELLNLLIRCFLVGNTDQSEFDCYQIMDSILQLLNDNKEKIRNLALEAIAAFASIGQVNKISEVLFQLNIEKEICDIVTQRLEQGMFPQVNPQTDGQIEIPFLEHTQNLDVDSVAHSMTNQTQVSNSAAQPPGSQDVFRRKGSIGAGSQGGINFQNQNQTPSHGQNRSHVHAIGMVPPHLISAQPRGNSSGRKIVVGTANATNQQQLGGGLLLSPQDEMMMQQAYMQSKRTASANAPVQLDSQFGHSSMVNGQLGMMLGPEGTMGHFQQVNFNNSNSGGNAPSSFNQSLNGAIVGLNGSSFLPSLQKITDAQHPQQFSSYSNHRERVMNMGGGANSVSGGSQPVKSIGYIGTDMSQQKGPMTKTQKRSNNYLHGTPGHQAPAHHHGLSGGGQHNGQGHFGQRGNSGKLRGTNLNHPINSVTSDQSPSLFEHHLGVPLKKDGRLASGSQNANNVLEMSGNMTNMLQDAQGIINGSGANSGLEGTHFKQVSTLGGSIGPIKGQAGYNASRQFSQQLSEIGGQTGVASGDISEIQSLSGLQSHSNYNQYQRTPIQQMNNNLMDMQQPQANNVLFSASSFKGSSTRGTRHQDHSSLQKNMLSSGIPMKGGGPMEAPSEMAYSQFENSQRNHYSNKVGIHQAKFTPDQQNLLRKVHGTSGPAKGTLNQAGVENSSMINKNLDQSLKLVIDNRRQKHSVPSSTKGAQGPQYRRHTESAEEMQDAGEAFEEQTTINRSFSHVQGERQLPAQMARQRAADGLSQAPPKSAGLAYDDGTDQAATGEDHQEHDHLADQDESQSPSDPALMTQSAKIVYVPLDELEPLEKPEKEFKKCISKGQGIYHVTDWLAQFEACNVIRRVCKHHQSLILQTVNQLQNLVGTLLKLAESLRSAVSRISLVTLQEMFFSLKRVMEPCLDPILKVLLKKGSDTNHFIAQAADQCLLALVQNCQEQKVLQILQLQNMWSRSSLYRLKICQCLQHISKALGNNILFFNQNDKLVVLLANYLTDASQDVRQAAKIAFVCMSQDIMGQNELEKLLQRVLNEVQYKKVKEVLDKEPARMTGAQGSQIDFVITASSQTKAGQKMQGLQNNNKISVKNQKQAALKHSHSINLFKQGHANAAGSAQDKSAAVAHTTAGGGGTNGPDAGQAVDPAPLSIQAKGFQQNSKHLRDSKSIIHPLSKQESGNLGQRTQSKPGGANQPLTNRSDSRVVGRALTSADQHGGIFLDQFFIDSLKDLILRTQINEWRSRYEATENLFELIKANIDKFEKSFKMIELADALAKLLTDTNAKIQLLTLENFKKVYQQMQVFIEQHFLIFYKALLTNLGSSNLGVRKNSDQAIHQILEILPGERRSSLLSPIVNMVGYCNNARLKPALIDKLVELLNDLTKSTGDQAATVNQLIYKQAVPLALKLLDDNKSEVKTRTEKLLRKLYTVLGQQMLFDACPQAKLQRVCDICLSGGGPQGTAGSSGGAPSGTTSNGKNSNSQGFGTGTFGANGASLQLNSRM